MTTRTALVTVILACLTALGCSYMLGSRYRIERLGDTSGLVVDSWTGNLWSVHGLVMYPVEIKTSN